MIDYFFQVSQRSRDERDAAIFGGTMGLVRRSALEAVGGWDEWCITEDAELSLRLQRAGWSGRHVDASFGHGVMPLTFEALKGQRFRWCFGGIQILRLHHRSLMPWNRDPDNRLSRSQRLAYLVGALQWFGDLLGLGFFAFLLLAAANIAFDGMFVVRRLSPVLLVAVPTLTALAIVRAVAGVRRVGRGTWREAFGALGIWLALTVTVARACVRGAVEPVGVFLRTPKTRGETSLRSSLRMNRIESVLGLAGATAAALVVIGHHSTSALLVAAMLGIAAAGYLAAPFNSIAALRAELPERLRRRRATERSRAWTRVTRHVPTRRAGLLVMILATAVGGVLALAPSIASNSTPGLGRQRSGPALLGGIDEHQRVKRASSTPPPPGSPRARPTDLTTSSPSGATGTTAGTTPALTPTATTPGLPPSSAALLPSSAPHTPTSTPAGATTSARATTPAAPTSSARVTTPAPVPTSPARTTPARTTPAPTSPAPHTTPAPAPTVRPTPSSTRRP